MLYIGLASEKSSDGFIVDMNHPKITKDIQRNTNQGSITNGTQVSERNILISLSFSTIGACVLI